MYRLGVDIGGTKVNMGILDNERRLCAKTKIMLSGSKDYKSVLNDINKVLTVMLAENNIEKSMITSAGIGVPGSISKDGRIAVKVPNVGWINTPAADEFEALTGIPAKLLQDSRAAAYGEYMAGSGYGKNVVVSVTLGTGIGTGIVIDGKIFDGGLGCAGEIGHIPVVENGRPCGCGKKGCLEKYAAGIGLAETAKELFGENATAESLFDRAKEGNREALAALDNVVKLLGKAMVSIVNLLSPDCIIFSGGMSGREECFINPLKEYIIKNSYSSELNSAFFVGVSKLGEDLPMIGAALI